ncbi:MAG: GNAT family N-acetyltransferase [Clostridium sp.]|nr:GNAT family N-acetyltransferase [Bacteroides sp.]MCM1197264.1 GNAT family N-acetyltransferase [Clostridium sp.]
MENIVIRNAEAGDIPLVAKCTMAAIGMYDFEEPMQQEQEKAYRCLIGICGMEDSLYSYRKARVAAVNGDAAGCLISYGGEGYNEARAKTFRIVKEEVGIDLSGSDTETGPGEYYLDTMALLPEFRGHSLGRRLMLDGIRKGMEAGYGRTTLIVDKGHPRLMEYYAGIGFTPEHEMTCFGDVYIKMSRPCNESDKSSI